MKRHIEDEGIQPYSINDIENLIYLFSNNQISPDKFFDFINTPQAQFDNEPLIHYILNLYKQHSSSDIINKLENSLYNLMTLDADPNVTRNKVGDPALHRAIKLKSPMLVKIILTSGKVDYAAKQYEYYQTLTEVCLEYWPENHALLQFLSKQNNNELQEHFLAALDEGNNKRITYFIKNNLVDFNLCSKEGFLPLHLLCVIGDVELICFVMDELENTPQKIDFRQQDGFGNTALHYACHHWGNPKANIVAWLLKNGTDPNTQNHLVEFPLHQAVRLSNIDILNLLIQYRADLSRHDRLGRTALSLCMFGLDIKNKDEMTKTLQKADPNIPSLPSHFNLHPCEWNFQKGFWIRVIGALTTNISDAITREIEILKRREKIDDDKLNQHNPKFDVYTHPEYTFSPATFIKEGVPIRPFDARKFSLIIETTRPIPAWCSGLDGEVVTNAGNDVDFKAKQLEFNYNQKHCGYDLSSQEISLRLSKLANEYICSVKPGLERYHMCSPETSGLPYNEGLFRYKRGEIKGILIEPNAKSAYYALQFFEGAGLSSIPFFHYHHTGQLEPVAPMRVHELAKGFNPNKNNPNQYNPYAFQFSDKQIGEKSANDPNLNDDPDYENELLRKFFSS